MKPLALVLATIAIIAFAASRSAATAIPADARISGTEGLTSSGNLSLPSEAPHRGALDPGNGSQDVLSSEGSLAITPTMGASLHQLSDGGGVWGTPPPTDASSTRSGWATYCAPTPTHCQLWGGDAMLGAVRSFRWGDEPYNVQVCGFEGGKTNCVLVTVVSFCGCGTRRGGPTLIDLSPAAFRSLAPLGRGVIRVQVDGIRR